MSDWIKCSDRLPARGDIVIGSGHLYDDPNNGRWVEPCILGDYEFHPIHSDEYGETMPDLDGTMAPTHWQPLPEPPTA